MLNSEINYVPIERANTSNARFMIPLPGYVSKDRIGLNNRGLSRLLKIGGISHLKVIGQTDQETTRFTPTIVGHDAKGNAYAGKKGEQTTIPEFTTSSEEVDPELDTSIWKPHAATWKNAVVNLNLKEMAQRIQQEKRWERGVYSTEAWAYHLNDSIKKSITEVGVTHLATGLSKDNWETAAGLYGGVSLVSLLFTQSIVPIAILSSITASGLMNVYDHYMYRSEDNGFRWSLMYGPQLDRALALKLIAKKTILVKALHP